VATNHYNWIRVSRQHPCPVCGKPDNCQVSRDGHAVWCGRLSEGSIQQNAGGQHLHVLKDADRLGGRYDRYDCGPRSHKVGRPPRDWTPALKFYAQNAATAVPDLAQRLGVSAASLTALEVGWHPGLRFWSIPERDADRRVIGIMSRNEDGTKRRLSGSKTGLTYGSNWDTGTGPILLVEGASDVAALVTIGLSAVGRPSNFGGVEHLIDLLFDVPSEREIVVISERDEKPDGKWPGRDGAISTAAKLAEALERPIDWAFPPDNGKDSRAWLKSMPALPVDRLADLFITGIDTKRINPPITLCIEPEPKEVLSLGTWRETMLQARLHSLGKPGIYLDRSPTGSGKSYVDLAAVQALLNREEAA
jgi:hypothetical protein